MKHNKRALGVFLATVLAFALASTVSIAQTSAYDYILRGERYLASGAADDAIREFGTALSIEPGNTRAGFGLGQAYEQRSKCARVFNYRMELMTEPETLAKLGFPPLTEQGYQDIKLALDAYSKAVASYPPYTEAYYRQGLLHFVSGRQAEARSVLEQAVAQERSSIPPAVLLAYVYLEDGNAQAAAAQIERIRSAAGDPANALILGASAVMEFRNGRLDLAETLLAQAVSRPDAPAYLYKMLGDVRLARGAHDQALEAYQQAAYRDTDSVLSRDVLGNMMRLAGQPSSATGYYTVAVAGNPNLTRAWFGLGSALLQSGSASQALGVLTDLANALPEYASDNALLLKGIAQWKLGNATGALATVNDALGINPGNRIATIYKTRIEREISPSGVAPRSIQPRSIEVGPTPDKPFTGVLINGGAPYTNSRSVKLGVYGDLTQVAFSNDGYTWSTWFAKPDPYGEFGWELAPGDGKKTVQMKFKGFLFFDITGEPGSIVLDTTPPTASVSITDIGQPAYAGVTNRVRASITARDSSGILGFWLSFDGNDWEWYDWYGSDVAITIPQTAMYGQKLYFSIVDGAGNHAPVEAVRPIADTTPPSIYGVQAAPGVYGTAAISWQTDEASDSYVEYWTYGSSMQRIGAGAMTTSHLVNLTGLQAGATYYYRVTSTDAAGNRAQSAEMTFRVQSADTTPPLISRVEASVTGRDSVAVTWWTDEPADSYVEYWASGISLARVGMSQMTTSHSVALTSIRSGVIYYYRVVSTDAAGNRAQSADMTFRLQPADTTPPLISRVEASAAGRDAVAVTWWTDEPSDSYVEYWASGISLARVGTSQMTTSHSVMLPNIRSGVVYYYRVVSTDTAGNRAQSADMTFRLQPPDTTPPTVRLSINNGAQLTNSTTVQLYITAQDDSGGALEMSLRDDKTQFGQWQPYTAYTTWRFSSGDGRRTVTVRVRDAAGNEAQASASITVDATPPAISWVEVKGIGPDSATVTWRTNKPSDSWVLFGPYSPSETRGQTEKATSHTVMLYGLNPNTTYYFKVRSADEAGNVAESATQTFRTAQRGNPPTGSIRINNGATYTRYYSVQLTISARDDYRGPIEMRLREGSGSWSGWMPLQTTFTYRISPGDGKKTVYVEFRDMYGVQSTTYSSSITLDTRPPRISNVKSTKVTANSATITWNTDEPATARVEYGTSGTSMRESVGERSISSADASAPAGDVGAKAIIITPTPSGSLRTSHSVSLTGLREKTTYYYQVVSSDAAGNVAVMSGFSFTTGGTTPPPPPPPPPTPGTVNVNWALASNGGRATASSYAPTKPDSAARPASNAIDGNARTYWEAASPGRGDRTEWIMVEFAKPQVINYIKTMSDVGYYPMEMTVEVEQDGRWVAVASFKSTSEQKNYMSRSGSTISFEFKFAQVTASRVRLSVRRVSNPTHAIQFYEVQAMNRAN
jgi:tetratricopeptide (TPR) repeat protein/fibronectin type 3 domain-containing protein